MQYGANRHAQDNTETTAQAHAQDNSDKQVNEIYSEIEHPSFTAESMLSDPDISPTISCTYIGQKKFEKIKEILHGGCYIQTPDYTPDENQKTLYSNLYVHAHELLTLHAKNTSHVHQELISQIDTTTTTSQGIPYQTAFQAILAESAPDGYLLPGLPRWRRSEKNEVHSFLQQISTKNVAYNKHLANHAIQMIIENKIDAQTFGRLLQSHPRTFAIEAPQDTANCNNTPLHIAAHILSSHRALAVFTELKPLVPGIVACVMSKPNAPARNDNKETIAQAARQGPNHDQFMNHILDLLEARRILACTHHLHSNNNTRTRMPSHMIDKNITALLLRQQITNKHIINTNENTPLIASLGTYPFPDEIVWHIFAFLPGLHEEYLSDK